METNEIIKELRKAYGLTQTDLGNILNCDRFRIADIERGKTQPNIQDIKKLSQHFNVSTDYLLGLTDVKTSDIDIKAICEYTGVSQRGISRMHTFFVENKSKNNTFLAGFNLFFGISLDSLLFFDHFYRVIESRVKEHNNLKAIGNSETDELCPNEINPDLEKAWDEERRNVAFEKFELYENLDIAINSATSYVIDNKIKLLGDCNADD